MIVERALGREVPGTLEVGNLPFHHRNYQQEDCDKLTD